jgi:hypothetical protein
MTYLIVSCGGMVITKYPARVVEYDDGSGKMFSDGDINIVSGNRYG